MPWVFDSSITLAWCFDDERTDETTALSRRLADDPGSVPTLWPLEVANVLSIAMRRRLPRITKAERDEFLEFLQTAQIKVDAGTMKAAWGPILSLADQYRLTVYDASYLELALRMGVELATLDRELRAAARAAGVKVIP